MRDEGVGQVVSFLVASILVVSVSAVVIIGFRSTADTEDRVDSLQAQALLDQLVKHQGKNWASGPDALTAMGLAGPDGGLDEAKLDALRGALEDSYANGKVDHAEFRDLLDIPDDLNYRFTVRPAQHTLIESSQYPYTKVVYIGHWVGPLEATVPLATSSEMLAAADAQLNLQQSADSLLERQILVDLGFDFDDQVALYPGEPAIGISSLPLVPDLLEYLGYSSRPGDVLPDDGQYLSNHIQDAIADADLLIVGSNVRQQELNPAAVNTAIADWVTAGGALIVLGSEQANGQWLQPLFHLDFQSLSGPIQVPNPGHPVLTAPNTLHYEDYDEGVIGLGFKHKGTNANYELFDKVLVNGEESTLSLSLPGAAGDGVVVSVAYELAKLADAFGVAEAGNLLQNLVEYTFMPDLYLVYGSDVPERTPTADAQMLTVVRDPDQARVPVYAEILIW